MLNFLNFSLKFTIVFIIVTLMFVLSTLWYFSIGLPDYKKLSNYQPPISSRVYSKDGRLIAELYVAIPTKFVASHEAEQRAARCLP